MKSTETAAVGGARSLTLSSHWLLLLRWAEFWPASSISSLGVNLCKLSASALLRLSVDPMRSEEPGTSHTLWLWIAVETGVLSWLPVTGVCMPVLVPVDLDTTLSLCEEDL